MCDLERFSQIQSHMTTWTDKKKLQGYNINVLYLCRVMQLMGVLKVLSM